MSKIIDIFGKFKSEQEKDEFLTAQFNTIVNLNKQVESLKAEKVHLERLLKENVPLVDGTTQEKDDGLTQEEHICKQQLGILQNLSRDRELTTEECRKVDVYAKILLNLRGTDKKKKTEVDGLSTEELLKLVKDDESTKVN